MREAARSEIKRENQHSPASSSLPFPVGIARENESNRPRSATEKENRTRWPAARWKIKHTSRGTRGKEKTRPPDIEEFDGPFPPSSARTPGTTNPVVGASSSRANNESATEFGLIPRFRRAESLRLERRFIERDGGWRRKKEGRDQL